MNMFEGARRRWERRGWRTLDIDEVISALSRVSESYETDQVFFVTDSSDRTIRPRNSLDVYVANNGHMSYGDLALFMHDANVALGRKADFLPLNHAVPESYIIERRGIMAYSA